MTTTVYTYDASGIRVGKSVNDRAISMIPYVGPYASHIVGLILSGVEITSNYAQIRQLIDEGRWFEASTLIVGSIAEIKSIVGSLKNYCFVEGTLVDTTEGKKPIETIEVGDYVTLQNGDVAQVEKVAYTVLETPIKVYNFTVEGLHNYYVGELEVQVHNSCKLPDYIKEI